MIATPAAAAAPRMRSHRASETAWPSKLSRFASSPKNPPPREAPSTPSSTSCIPGTCHSNRSTSSSEHSREARRALLCIGSDCVLPFRRAAMAASASLRSSPIFPRRSRTRAAASSASGAARHSRYGCALTSSPSGHVPTRSRSRSARHPDASSHQRSKAAQPRGDASHVRAKNSGPASPRRKLAYAVEATGGQSGTPAPLYRSTTATISPVRLRSASETGSERS